MLKALALEFLILIGLGIFARGFLPPTRTRLGYSEDVTPIAPRFERVIFMVVDAMRSDFLYSETNSQMNYTHSLLRDGNGFAFTAFSDPPTVTLPRLKGLTTGASPNFLDAVINIAESDSASTLQNQDSWIHQLRAQNKSIHMFGDDTWLKLFPDTFEKVDGTSSFYVADFTEVDVNVTRHLPEELGHGSQSSAAWDALILHYLGLDHIGHKGGPYSIHMPDKLREMDAVVQTLYESLDDKTLLVVAGDHGMNEVGNHGGASEGETSAALAFFAKGFNNKLQAPMPNAHNFQYYSKVYQVDIVPTLAVLLGFPIPKNSLGVFIEELLPLWDSEKDKETIMQTNCRQLEIDITSDPDACSWSKLRQQQTFLMRTSSEHIIPYMVAGLLILLLTSLITFTVCVRGVLSTVGGKLTTRATLLSVWWIIVPVLYFAGMLGSSTVEEEHFIWYWVSSGLIAVLFVALPNAYDKLRVLVLLGCFRIIRGWNSAGQKWNDLTDTTDILNSHPTMKWALVVGTFLFFALGLSYRQIGSRKVVTLLTAAPPLLFKYFSVLHPLSLPWMVSLARKAFLSCFVEMLSGGSAGYGIQSGIRLLLLMQTKPENIPLWIPITLAREILSSILNDTNKGSEPESVKVAVSLFIGLLVLCFEYVTFFATGGSNSLATVDLSNAYNGVSGYNIPLVAVLTYLGNWAPSIYWALALPKLPIMRSLRAWFYSAACTAVALACLMLREHLFIWTVFSPKLLYVGAWLVFHEMVAVSLVSVF